MFKTFNQYFFNESSKPKKDIDHEKFMAHFNTNSLECLNCVHYNIEDLSRCEAYPEGIPHAIITGKVKHRKPYTGDKGIVFKEK